jgi:hypothetical protein
MELPQRLLSLGRTTNDSSGSVTVSGMADDLAVNAVRSGAAANNGTLFQRVDHWYFENYGGGNRTFTATYSGSVQFRGIDVVELSGALLAGSAGPTSSATGTSAAPSSGATGVPASDGTYFLEHALVHHSPQQRHRLVLFFKTPTTL